MKVEIEINGMHCNNCALGIEKKLKKNISTSAAVSFALGKAVYITDDSTTIDKAIIEIQQLGFDAVHTTNSIKSSDEVSLTKPFQYRLYLATVASLVIAFFLMASMYIDFFNTNLVLIQCIVCLPVYVFGTYYFGLSAAQSIRAKLLNMDVLIVSGVQLSFWFSFYNSFIIINHNYVFFEVTASIISFVLVGNLLEHHALMRSKNQINSLYSKVKFKAKRLRDNGFEECNQDSIVLGDSLIVCNGDVIPCDGSITQGAVEVDESMLSGESNAVTKSLHSEVLAGTIVVNGNATLQATKTYANSYICNLLNMVDAILIQKPRIQRVADVMAAWFVPLILSLMCVTFVITYFILSIPINDAMLRSIAVGVIACPCAMGLATPTAIIVGLGRAFASGIIFKNAESIEMLSKAKQFVFDKTGTLTTGKYQLVKTEVFNTDISYLLDIVYALELNSNHPIAKNLVSIITPKSTIKFAQVKELIGNGVEASDENNIHYSIKTNINSSSNGTNFLELAVHKNEVLIGILYLEDELKPNADKVFQYLRSQKFALFILSGDIQKRVQAVANLFSITRFYYELNPSQKLQKIDEIKQYEITVMVGDGVNDALALSKADIGISFSSANDIAMHSADVILLDDDILKIKQVHLLSKHIVSTIKLNLAWAVAYNIIAIPIAASGLLSPMWACVCMAMSDVLVIGNSILLKYKKI